MHTIKIWRENWNQTEMENDVLENVAIVNSLWKYDIYEKWIKHLRRWIDSVDFRLTLGK